MSVMATADWHLSDNPRDAYRFKALKRMRKQIKEHKVTRLLMLGDITEAKDRHSSWLVNRVVEELDAFADICDVDIMRGNHDYLEIDHPFYQFVQHIEGIRWINRPGTYPVDELGNCLFLPHTRDYKKDWQGITLEGHPQIFAHNTFQGAVVESGREMDGIPTDVFPQLRNHVVSGDIHVPQRVGPVIYTGAPYTVDFGDDYEPRVLLLRKGAVPESIPIPGPQKVVLDVTPIDLKKGKPDADKGDIAKVRVHMQQDEYAKWAEIRDNVREWCVKYGLELYSTHPMVDKANGALPTAKHVVRTDEQLLRAYAKSQSIDDRTLERGIKLL